KAFQQAKKQRFDKHKPPSCIRRIIGLRNTNMGNRNRKQGKELKDSQRLPQQPKVTLIYAEPFQIIE
ncbi:hypothetical protein, partial [Prevotella pectinovora]|uniref:hypothetical protein n=1 Tax=Prevotella pectinovora TaxID=1602169 RepID=UPI003A94DB78